MRRDGATEPEGRVLDALAFAVQAWEELPVEHPSEAGDFYVAIHRLQDLMAARIVRRDHSRGWPTYVA